MTVLDATPGPSGADGAKSDGAVHWYQDAVIYELHVRAFNDSDGDGIGDFRGLIERLDYLQQLGVTALWLLPFYPSPLRDDGYDISDYEHVHPSYGSMRDFRRFLREAHRRGLKVITELVLAHTSDEHPWFQRARVAPPGSSARDFYVWSDTPDKFRDARIIFKDFETSNWTYDDVAGAYFWHRFYSHQPSLNYDNPAVRDAMFDVVDFWLEQGVDGLRLDAVPYLYAREGTSCENLPETLEFLSDLRAHVDGRFDDRMLLAEANQWPEDAVAYMGDGDRCQMAFHFPLMPRMFMAARQEDRFPIVDILSETPAAPEGCQWALFLRNHDELTLEMVTDEERDYMYRTFAEDPQARVNMGIRRRLAPLLGNDRTLIEMMNGLLFSLPGTPIIYYGDEIGMGDNIYLGDRDAVRTPMQWDSDRNAGFSKANPQRLYLPVVIDPGFHAQAVNVEAQEENANSLLWWTRRLVHLRRRFVAFGRGSIELLRADNRKVLAFLRRFGDETILVVANLSRFAQGVELDLSQFRGAVPVELFGNMSFPPIGDLPYFVTLGPHGFYWFSLENDTDRDHGPRRSLSVAGSWGDLLTTPGTDQIEAVLPGFLAGRRWFASKSRRILRTHVVASVPLTFTSDEGRRQSARITVVQVEFDSGQPELYVVPLAFANGDAAAAICRWKPEAVVADLRAAGQDGVLYDAIAEAGFSRAAIRATGSRRSLTGDGASLAGAPTRYFRRLVGGLPDEVPITPVTAEQSNSSVTVDERAVLKFVRRVEEGVNPGVELGRFLDERAGFPHAPRVAGSLELRLAGAAAPMTIALLDEYVPNEGDGWGYVVDLLTRGLEEAVTHGGTVETGTPPALATGHGAVDLPFGHFLLGPHLTWSTLLGRRVGELHRVLAVGTGDPDFAPEALTAADRQSMYHGARRQTRRTVRQSAAHADPEGRVAAVVAREQEVIERLRRLSVSPVAAQRMRVHGDLHLGQALWTGKDFVIIDFEGEPARSLVQRRAKRPAAFDVAAMVRSIHYASRAATMRLERDLTESFDSSVAERWADHWYRWVSWAFVDSYLDAVGGAAFLADDAAGVAVLLEFFLLEKAVSELDYEANHRPEWVEVPAQGILDLLDGPR